MTHATTRIRNVTRVLRNRVKVEMEDGLPGSLPGVEAGIEPVRMSARGRARKLWRSVPGAGRCGGARPAPAAL